MGSFLSVIIDILQEPSIIIALVVILGLILQGKRVHEIVTPAIKAMVGFLIISAAADIIVASLEPLGAMIEEGFNVKGVIPNNEAIVAVALKEFGRTTALIMIFGMITNLIIARITKYKYVFLTGHHTFYYACMLAVILTFANYNLFFILLNGALFLGIVMIISPAICQPGMRAITKSDDIALGHFSGLGYALSYVIGKLVGKNSRSTEELNIPQQVSFLRDSTVSISITMIIVYFVGAIAAGPTFIEENLSNGQNFLVFALIKALTFTAGFIVIQTGVRLVLGEIVPAFKGISEKLIPNSKPALDVPVVYPFAPNAVVIGFISSFIGGLVSLVILATIGGVVIIPGVVPHFFTGAAAGVFGNSKGGIRGAISGAFANGILISFLPLLILPYLEDLGFSNTTFSDADFAVGGSILGYLTELVNGPLLTVILVIVIGFMTLISYIPKRGVKDERK